MCANHLTNGNSPILPDSGHQSTVDVLAVDDEPDVLDLTMTFLERERDTFEVHTETDPTNVLCRLDEISADAIVSDYEMPRMDGLELLKKVREDHEDIPFILFTGKGSEEIASKAISKGVTDYLQKQTGPEQYSLLANRLLNTIEKYRASQALEHSQEKFSKLVKNSSDVIGIVDKNGIFRYISPACERTLGYTQAELTGESAFDYMPPADREAAMTEFFQAVEDPSIEPEIEFQFETSDGSWMYLEARGKNLFADNLISGFVVNARDVTDQKKREQALTQQNERLRNMRKAVSHDLQNPLTIASDSLSLYRETDDDKWLDKVESALTRIDNLTDQVVALSKCDIDSTDDELISLESAIESAWDMVDTETATLLVEDTKSFSGDPERLRQAFENLIRNAITHSDGEVEVWVGTTDKGFYFKDNGPGIPVEERDQVFESGYSTRGDSTGFGLTIVEQILTGHGWDITVCESNEGGARFDITGVTFEPTVYE